MITDVHNVTIAEAATVMIFSMAIVFFVLLIISFMMDLIRMVFGEKQKAEVVKDITPQVKKTEITSNTSKDDDEELIAVITAAIAAELSCSTRDIRLKSINRKNTPVQPWAEAGKHENMLNRI
jgi:sodium pump decarboxylase gamma subunit